MSTEYDLRIEVARLQAEVARLRGRISVIQSEDVEALGVTWAHVNAWLVARGEQPHVSTPRMKISYLIMSIAEDEWPSSANAWRILDEMAAMEVGA